MSRSFYHDIEDGFRTLVSQMLNLNKSDKEIQEDLAIFNEEKKEDEELLIEKADLFEINLCEDGGRRLGDLIGCEPANGFFKLVFELTCHRQP